MRYYKAGSHKSDNGASISANTVRSVKGIKSYDKHRNDYRMACAFGRRYAINFHQTGHHQKLKRYKNCESIRKKLRLVKITQTL